MIKCIRPPRHVRLGINWLETPCSTGLIPPRRHYAARAPSVRRAEAQRKRRQPQQNISPERLRVYIPPISFFNDRKASGLLRSEPEATRAFLEDYMFLGSDATPARVQNLCDVHDIPPSALPSIAFALFLPEAGIPKNFPVRILLAAVDLKVPLATYFVISRILERNDARELSQPYIRPALQHLSDLSSRGDDPNAMVLQGRLLLFSNRDTSALEVLQLAIERYKNMPAQQEELEKVPTSKELRDAHKLFDGVNSRGMSLSDAYVGLGQINVRRKKLLAAGSFFRLAVEQDDNSEAWFELGKLLESRRLLSPNRQAKTISRAKTANRLPSTDQASIYINPREKTLIEEKELSEDLEKVDEEVERCFLKAASKDNVPAIESLAKFYNGRYSNSTAANPLPSANLSSLRSPRKPDHVRLHTRILDPKFHLRSSRGLDTTSRTTTNPSIKAEENKLRKNSPGANVSWPTHILRMIEQWRRNTRIEKNRLWAQEWSELNNAVSEAAVAAAAAGNPRSNTGSV
ncbi:MAG: hypothetical protein M1823_002683 [Watsoniomyces obsoletus]|nr:MAG: hypothetical protein M1823_002683 [Watsoniomyces obsoletus]